jgi:transcriptional regulator
MDFLQGTLDLLILKALALGPMHGYGVFARIGQRSAEKLAVPQGSLHPALHRLEYHAWIQSEWSLSDNNRRAKFYSLTHAGRKQLEHEAASWANLAEGNRNGAGRQQDLGRTLYEINRNPMDRPAAAAASRESRATRTHQPMVMNFAPAWLLTGIGLAAMLALDDWSGSDAYSRFIVIAAVATVTSISITRYTSHRSVITGLVKPPAMPSVSGQESAEARPHLPCLSGERVAHHNRSPAFHCRGSELMSVFGLPCALSAPLLAWFGGRIGP